MAAQPQSVEILRTKLHRPPVAPDVVCRKSLHERLDAGVQLPLALVSAPAGYGKSTLISHWLQESSVPNAWLTLGDEDNGLHSFVEYAVSALRTIYPDACSQARHLCRRSELPPVRQIAEILVNEFETFESRVILALDEYGRIHDSSVHELVSALLACAGQGLHLVIMTRRDPPLPLHRMRAAGQLVELRQRDLQFETDAAIRFLRDVVTDPQRDATLVELARTVEGWGVGLRLAKLALQQGRDLDALVEGMSGTVQYISDYLASEVVDLQPPEVQETLCRLSILERFCQPLVEVILEDAPQSGIPVPDPDALLNRLFTSNLFCIPLDVVGQWYRFHHLFQDFLKIRLQAQMSAEGVAKLCERASNWFSGAGYFPEALTYAFASGVPAAPEAVLDRCRHGLMQHEQWQTLADMVGRISDRGGGRSINFLVAQAWVFEQRMRYAEMVECVKQIEKVARTANGKGELKDSMALQGEVKSLLAARAAYAGSGRPARDRASEALGLLPKSLSSVRSFTTIVQSLGYQMMGASGRARSILMDMYSSKGQNDPHFRARALVGLCVVAWRDADLSEIQQLAPRLQQLAEQHELRESLAFSHYFQGIASYDCDQLEQAIEHLREASCEGMSADLITYAHSSFVLALAFQAQGREPEAREVAESVYAHATELQNTSLMGLAKAFLAELAFRQGRRAEALQWADEVELGPPGGFFRFYVPHLTLARVLAQDERAEAVSRLAPYLDELETVCAGNNSKRVLMDVLTLQAILAARRGERERAHAAMGRALALALPSGCVRFALDAGPEAGRLLHEMSLKGETLQFAGKILAGLQGRGTGSRVAETGASQGSQQALIDPLSEREMEVLALVADHLADKEIAERLFISPGTVKSHTKRIYAKLAVHGRREAVDKANGLGMLRN